MSEHEQGACVPRIVATNKCGPKCCGNYHAEPCSRTTIGDLVMAAAVAAANRPFASLDEKRPPAKCPDCGRLETQLAGNGCYLSAFHISERHMRFLKRRFQLGGKAWE